MPRGRGTAVSAAGVWLLLAAGAAGCGSGGAAGVRVEARAPERPGPVLELPDDGLPPGFSARPRAPWTPPFRPADAHCRTLLDAAGAHPPQDGLRASTAAGYQGDRLGETAGVRVSVYRPGAAARHLGALAEAMRHCRVATSGTPDGGDRLTRVPLPLGRIGEETVAGTLAGRVGGYPYRLHLVFSRVGPALVSVAHAGLDAPDPRHTERIARFLTEHGELIGLPRD